MRKSLLSLAVASAFAMPSLASAQTPPAAAAPASPHTFTANTALVSDYRFRGISQTFKLPAIQGGFDYSHSSGAYVGTWASNVSGLQYPNGASMEWDFYGGYKWEPMKDLGVDVGTLYYYYPGAKTTPAAGGQSAKYDNWEIYAGASYQWFSAKLFYSLTDYFGLNNKQVFGTDTPPGATFPACGVGPNGAAGTSNCYGSAPGNSKGSTYLDLTATVPVGGFNIVGHWGHTKVRHWGNHSYSDWKLGVTKDWNGWVFGAAYVDTNAKKEWYRATTVGFVAPPGAANTGQKIKELGGSTIVFSASRTF